MKDQARRTWIVVADGGQARIFLNTHRDGGLSELPLASRHEPRLASHAQENAAHVHHTPVFKPTQEQRDEGAFLNTLAAKIETGVSRRECEQLVLVAPATAMGLLRKALSPETRKHLVAEIVQDYTHQTGDFIMDRVRTKLPL